MSVVGTIPLQVKSWLRADVRNLQFAPVKYAYCLLDLMADDTKKPNKVFKKYPALINEKISEEIIWQLPCRTNGNGYLIPVDTKNHTLMNVFLRNDSAAQKYIDRFPPLLFNLGINFNLFWTYDYLQFQEARGNSKIVQKENQTHLCSTMFNGQESKIFLSVLIPHSLNLRRTDASKRNELAEKIKKLLLRKEHKFHRFVIHSGAHDYSTSYSGSIFTGKTITKFKIKPHLQVRDQDLGHALGIADKIIKASEAPKTKDYFGHIARLEEVLRIVNNNDKKYILNDKVGLYKRCEAQDSRYSLAKWRIESSFKNLENYIKRCQKKYEPLYFNSIVQAVGHYEKSESRLYVEKLQKAAGIAATRALWDDFLCSESNYKKKLAIIKEVRKGKSPKDFVDKILASYKEIDSAGLDKLTGFVEASSSWVESFLPKLIKQKPNELASTINRINHLLEWLDEPNSIDKPIKDVVKVVNKDISVTLKDASGKIVKFNLKESLSKAAGVSARISNFCSVVNTALALKDALEKPEFKTILKLMKETADVANAFQSVRNQVTKHFGLTEIALKRIAGSAMIVLSFMEASDHLKQGNNLAILGDMLVATAGTINILSKGGAAGWIAAGCVLAGTVIIYSSLDDDEKFLLGFEDKKYWSSAKYASDHRFLRNEDLELKYHDDYLKIRGS